MTLGCDQESSQVLSGKLPTKFVVPNLCKLVAKYSIDWYESKEIIWVCQDVCIVLLNYRMQPLNICGRKMEFLI